MSEVLGQYYKGGETRPGKRWGEAGGRLVRCTFFHREAPPPINNKDSVSVDKR